MIALLIGALGYASFLLLGSLRGSGRSSEASTVPTAVARVTTLMDKVVEQGELESQSTVNGNCEIDGYEHKVIFLAPEGTLVKKGQIVVKFDPSKIKENITERETSVNEQLTDVETARQELKVQIDENEIATRKAKQTLEFADLDLKKYVEGDYLVKNSEAENNILEAQTALAKAKRDKVSTRALVKRGFREVEQLREMEQVVKSSELKLKNANQKLVTLEKFEHVKSLAEFTGKAEEATYGLKIAETTAKAKLAKAEDRLKNEERGLEIQKKRLVSLKESLEKHEVKAPQDGTLAFARDDWRGNGEKIHEGSVVHQNQTIFVLPDMLRMQVKVGIHETLVSKVKVGQSAVIRPDAFPGQPLFGQVKSVSPLSASTRWEPSNNYHVVVEIDDFPESMKLKPGMNAEVEIRVGEYPDVLAIPIQAVTSFGNKKFAFVQDEDEFKTREIETGKSNLSFVAIKSGLEADEVVALDAYQRGLAEFGTNDSEEDPMLKIELEKMEAAAKAKAAESAEAAKKDAAEGAKEEGKEKAESEIGQTSNEVTEGTKEEESKEEESKAEKEGDKKEGDKKSDGEDAISTATTPEPSIPPTEKPAEETPAAVAPSTAVPDSLPILDSPKTGRTNTTGRARSFSIAAAAQRSVNLNV